MKKYEEPKLEVQIFEVEDVITASNGGDVLTTINGHETPNILFE